LAAAGERPPVITLGVTEMPGSGKPAELLRAAGIDAAGITSAAWRLLQARASTAHAQ
jgi:transketolase